MSFNLQQYKNNLLFIPLGGACEIGMNLNIYWYQEHYIIVDIGIGFADPYFPGIEIIVPKIAFISRYAKNISGIVLTHAHEDHLGGLPYLWPELKAPVYATKFTSNVLKAKLAEFGLSDTVPLHEVQPNKQFQVGPFSMEFINVTHSIPDNHSLLITTEHGRIFHTGDWKLDDDPIIGDTTNISRLSQIGNEGILAIVGDSTNIFCNGTSGSEGKLRDSLHRLISGYNKGMVVITTFASNVARLRSLAQAAEDVGRTVILAGRSLWRIYRAALESGYLHDVKEFMPESEIHKLKRETALVICTGCQGEPLAAASKLANGQHPNIRLTAGDTMIFSSKIIPGNEKKIFHLFNKLCKMGVEVLTERDHFVHVSGHPSRDEVSMMYKLLKPIIAIPVHGEAMHIHEHAKFARIHDCQYTFEISNGDVLLLDKTNPRKVGQVEAGYTLIDGNALLNEHSYIIRSRRKMRDNGVVLISLAVIRNNARLANDPIISAPGILDPEEDKELLKAMAIKINNAISYNNKHMLGKPEPLEKTVIHISKKFIKQETGKFPEVIVHTIAV